MEFKVKILTFFKHLEFFKLHKFNVCQERFLVTLKRSKKVSFSFSLFKLEKVAQVLQPHEYKELELWVEIYNKTPSFNWSHLISISTSILRFRVAIPFCLFLNLK